LTVRREVLPGNPRARLAHEPVKRIAGANPATYSPRMSFTQKRDLASDFVLPTILFAALGGMTWAVRGCSGYGASAGCLFAGVT
jgi:hypothetical protein